MVKEKHIDKTKSKKCAECGSIFYRDKRCTWAHWGRAKFCCSSCAGIKIGRQRILSGGPWLERISGNVSQETNGCIMWSGPTNGSYGLISWNGKNSYVHRVALEQKIGRSINDGMFACHTCDNPRCVNPEHLYEGDSTSNGFDASIRKRIWWAKLTDSDARDIRASKLKPAQLSEIYNVSDAAIRKVINRQTFKHVE